MGTHVVICSTLLRMAPKTALKQPRKSRSTDTTALGTGARQSATERSAGVGLGSKASRNEIEGVFDKLRILDRIEGGDVIGAKGIQQLCTDLGIKLDALEGYVLIWRLGSLRQNHITRQEWLVAMYTYSIDSILQLKMCVLEWTKEIKSDPQLFADMYNYLFDYIRGENDRFLPYQNATAAWGVLLADLPNAAMWTRWVTEQYTSDISRDVWQQCRLFLSTTPDLSVFSPGGKWPSSLDDFAEWWKSQQKH